MVHVLVFEQMFHFLICFLGKLYIVIDPFDIYSWADKICEKDYNDCSLCGKIKFDKAIELLFNMFSVVDS